MINVTLVASTPQEAYALAKEKYGSDFTLISAKQIRYGAHDKLSCEITVSISKERFLQPNEVSQKAESTEEPSLLQDQLSKMKSLLKDKISNQDTLKNTLIEKVKTRFLKKGIAKEWLDTMIEPLIGSTVTKDEKELIAYLLQEIDETIEIKEEVPFEQKVMMFVGPTGVGKTTTIAKLAARYAFLMEKKHRVALLNLDSFKVGAFEQLAHFADIMQLKYVTANNAAQFTEVFATLKGYDVILIDTAGMSPYDTQKLVKTVEYLNLDTTQPIEVTLLISATVKYDDIKDIHDTFSFLNLDSVILSKFDETKHLGEVLSYLLLHPTPLSYFSVGQEVPDDLVVADKEYLLSRFIGDLDGENGAIS